ncbi:ankyrin [Dissoconium aciculare CBS 342.82]|uniref:Ankyrin n=1 Tax=Dissoconium aciculare CBS 342.82 TaxID=1314786 RepID=A0A6J3MAU9_9PEZI|nr:ankyrin [Dissoconium aciculare CBS 342.82]KAF1824759.1 ankyrin [Dissoconium aciculare CBS 342.82]
MLDEMPKDLNRTYARILRDIPENRQPFAWRLLKWVAYSQSPLSMSEVKEAMRISVDEVYGDAVSVGARNEYVLDRTLRSLQSLVEPYKEYECIVDKTNGEVQPRGFVALRLTHFSVVEFLELWGLNFPDLDSLNAILQDHPASSETSSDIVTHPFSRAIAQEFMARCCLGYLRHYSDSPQKMSNITDLDNFKLLKYAARSWFIHAAFAGREVAADVSDFICNMDLGNDWLKVYNPSAHLASPFSREIDRERPGSLALAAFLGDQRMVFNLFHHPDNSKFWAKPHIEALFIASRYGHAKVVKVLLERRQRTLDRKRWSLVPEDNDIETALVEASAGGHVSAVRELTEYNPSTDSQENAQTAAAARSYVDLVVEVLKVIKGVRVTLWPQVEVSTTSGCHRQLQSRRFLPILVSLFVERGVWTTSAINAATEHHQTAVVDLLSVGQRNSVLHDSLLSAAFLGYIDIVRLLLGRGVSDPAQVLHMAAVEGHADIVRLERSRTDKIPHLALRHEATHNNPVVVNMLLEYGAIERIEDGRAACKEIMEQAHLAGQHHIRTLLAAELAPPEGAQDVQAD